MRRMGLIPGLILAMLPLCGGCASMSNTAKGIGIGSGIGAGIGAIAGSGQGKAGKGAVIGSLVGGTLGAIVGNDADQQEKKELQNRVAEAESKPKTSPLGITDVQVLVSKGWSDEMILAHLKDTGSSFQLSTTDIQWLRDNGVSDRVVREMMQMKPRPSGPQRTTTVIYRDPPPPRVIYESYPVQPIYVVPAPPPPPPPSFGVGIHYRR
jgi:Glycine zipper